MKLQQANDSLQKIADSEFERIFDSPWHRFPPVAVRDELIRRLKLRVDLSIDDKRVKYKEILDRFQIFASPKSWDRLMKELSEIEAVTQTEKFKHDKTLREARIKEMDEHYRQLREIHSQRDDPFAGKSKPGDWRPDKSELCPVCDGNGKGADKRICGKCSGRGFIRS